MKSILIIISLSLISGYSIAQQDTCLIDDFPSNKQEPAAYCGDITGYRPDQQTIKTKYVRVNFHVMQKGNGLENFQENDTSHMIFLKSIIPDCNVRLRNLAAPYYGGATGDPYIVDSKIQFVLKDIYFHQDDIGWSNNNNICGSYSYANYAENETSELNIFFVEGITGLSNGGGCGYAYYGEWANYLIYDGWYEIFLQHPPGTYGPDHLGGIPWIKNQGMLHEIGHCLNLQHSWNGQFSDMYIPEEIGWCNPAVDSLCTNNIMSYSRTKDFFSPMQLEFMHKELTFSWRKKLVVDCKTSISNPVVISQNENWDYAVAISGMFSVTNFATIDVSCKFDILENSQITIDQFSTLNFNSADISTCKSCTELTFNILGTVNFNNTQFNLPENASLNISSTGVVNINSAEGICLNQSTHLNIANGGKIYINGVDYTALLAGGYANVYDNYFNNQTVTGNHYAINKIQTSGNVQTQGVTNLTAGRRIVFKPGFVGKPGLKAKIDANINNCKETPCVNQGSSLKKGSSSVADEKEPENNAVFNKKVDQELVNEVHIQVYPNPNEGLFVLKIEGIDKNTKIDFSVNIYNTLGVVVYHQQVSSLENNIMVDNIPSGIYHVSVSNATSKLGQIVIIR
jgi:hypothetical protein